MIFPSLFFKNHLIIFPRSINIECLSLSLAISPISESEVCIENQCLSVSLSILELFSLHYDTFLQKTKARTCAVFQRGKKEHAAQEQNNRLAK